MYLASDILVKPFDPTLPTELLTDASKLWGLGFVLMQREQSGKPRLIPVSYTHLTLPTTPYV